MNLMDTMMDEFHDEQKFKELNEREVAAWLEVLIRSVSFFNFLNFFHRFFFLPYFQCIYLFSCVWSLGASIDARGRKDFDKVLREIVEVNRCNLFALALTVMCTLLLRSRSFLLVSTSF